jgi:quinol monooxygenase YgiN
MASRTVAVTVDGTGNRHLRSGTGRVGRIVKAPHILSHLMPTIRTGDRPMTVINVFTVAPENQRRLVELLSRATESSVRHVPGFVSAALHRSLDGTKVTMYAQWATPEDYDRMRARPDASPILAEALSIAQFDPGFYEVSAVFDPGELRLAEDPFIRS